MFNRSITQLNSHIIHVKYTDMISTLSNNISKNTKYSQETLHTYELENDYIVFKKNNEEFLRETGVSFYSKDVYRFQEDKKNSIIKKQTANGEVHYKATDNCVFDYSSNEAVVKFKVDAKEILTGLGQKEDGILDLRNCTEYLYQTNLKISIPFLVSANNYGILIDTESAVIYSNENGQISFDIHTTDIVSYYVIWGDSIDEVIYWFRELTGTAELLPRWSYGYIQSKEKYSSAEEIICVVKKFREEKIPLDCIVQDWQSWKGNLWGEKKVDKERYPDLKGMIEWLHNHHTKLMWSIWPNMSPLSNNYAEFKRNNLLLPNSNIYNAFDEKGRKLYWKQCKKSLFSAGVDAWWCDNAEPFSDAEWNGAIKREEKERYQVVLQESQKHMPWEKLNSYGLYHAKGIYENWRETNSKKRVVNLTRSTYTFGQKYGVILWSGDISASWDTLKKQIVEGLRMSLSGFPYWTLDIGGFFTVKDKWQNRGCGNHNNPEPLWFWNGDYNDGVNDLGYRELYTRWLQLGVFLPMFRSHGTDTPREPWNFKGDDNSFYNAILKFIRLRYKILPYIYSVAAAVYREHSTIMRSFLFDFPDDEKAIQIVDSFMFGKSLLIAPVLEAMYYEKNSVPITGHKKIRSVYLPKGTGWYDYWTNEYYEGGSTINKDVPIDVMPIYVKAGAILPCSDEMLYADEYQGRISQLYIYEGADGEIVLYNDEGDNYSYQNGNYSAIKVKYNDKEKSVIFESAEGNYPFQTEWSIYFVKQNQSINRQEIRYAGEYIKITA